MTATRRPARRPTMRRPPPPPGYDEIQHEELARLFGQVTRARLLGVPIALGLLVWLAATPITPWRRGLLASLGVLAMVVIVHEVLRFRRRGLGRRAFVLNFGFAALVQGTAALATGGLESPVLVAMFPLATAGAMLVEPPVLFLLLCTQVAAIWAMAWIKLGALLPNFNPAIFAGVAHAGWTDGHVLWVASFATLTLGVATFVGRHLRTAFDSVLRRGLEARHEVLRAHAEQTRELAALSGEIAHELKNPLASIKGLAALLAEDAPPGKPSERLAVLRREVGRMQTILEEFLNFSRPLVPLSLENADLWALAEEVAEMHEGTAHERNLRVVVKGAPCTVRCDPRKIKQAVINLVQNALEASPSGATVELHIEGAEAARVRVLDRGPGIAAELGDKVFAPGVTSKAHGSGLGLTITRALVRQHGGEVTLAPREGGGTVATMRLPRGETPP